MSAGELLDSLESEYSNGEFDEAFSEVLESGPVPTFSHTLALADLSGSYQAQPGSDRITIFANFMAADTWGDIGEGAGNLSGVQTRSWDTRPH